MSTKLSFFPALVGMGAYIGYGIGGPPAAATVIVGGIGMALMDKGPEGLKNAALRIKQEAGFLWQNLSNTDKYVIPIAAGVATYFSGVETGIASALALSLYKYLKN